MVRVLKLAFLTSELWILSSHLGECCTSTWEFKQLYISFQHTVTLAQLVTAHVAGNFHCAHVIIAPVYAGSTLRMLRHPRYNLVWTFPRYSGKDIQRYGTQ